VCGGQRMEASRHRVLHRQFHVRAVLPQRVHARLALRGMDQHRHDHQVAALLLIPAEIICIKSYLYHNTS